MTTNDAKRSAARDALADLLMRFQELQGAPLDPEKAIDTATGLLFHGSRQDIETYVGALRLLLLENDWAAQESKDQE